MFVGKGYTCICCSRCISKCTEVSATTFHILRVIYIYIFLRRCYFLHILKKLISLVNITRYCPTLSVIIISRIKYILFTVRICLYDFCCSTTVTNSYFTSISNLNDTTYGFHSVYLRCASVSSLIFRKCCLFCICFSHVSLPSLVHCHVYCA